MRFAFIAVLLGACGAALGQDAESGTVSVLAPASTTATTVAPAPTATEVVAVPAPVVVYSGRGRRSCVGGECRLYNVEAEATETCRPRLFGGFVKRSTSRVVYRPAR